ncbi:MAG: VOC family protein [Chloroflexi bacterium]|nr:VOC family protein [Chloroflexota bacterium]
MTSRIRYLAIGSSEPDRVARFYMEYLGMEEIGRSSAGEVSVTDGVYNLSFLPPGDGVRQGLSHFGVAVDDIEDVRERLAKFSPGAKLERDRGGVHYGEYRLQDPEGYPVSISASEFGMSSLDRRVPSIHHLAICERAGQKVAEFCADVLGLEKRDLETWRWIQRQLTDGITGFTVLADADQVREHGQEVTVDHQREGLNHFGLEANVPELLARLPREANATQRTDRPDSHDYFRVWDPDGNHFDLRSVGFWSRGG